MKKWMMSVAILLGAVSLWAADAGKSDQANLRTMRYTSRSPEEALKWQRELRSRFLDLLNLKDLVKEKDQIGFDAKELSREKKDGYVLKELEINSTPGRRIKVLLATPTSGESPHPAVVCIHGHGGTRNVVYDKKTIYKGFAAELAQRGYVTIATNVGQHEVYEEGRTLMGERLWDLMRCVDYLETMPEVDPNRIGCGGLSLGGEMAMWLGAMDTRIAASVSCGFLTRMDQMEQNHCMCWKFDGLRELVDYADIYAMTAPRPLLCQNGRKEPPSQFPPSLARKALAEIKPAYADFGKPENVGLKVHDGAHEVHLPSMLAFYEKHLGRKGEQSEAQ